MRGSTIKPERERLLVDNPVFGSGPPAARLALLEASRVLELEARARVLSEGEPAQAVYALERGAVRVFIQAGDGDEVSCKLFRAPTIFGEAEAFTGVRFQENVETLEPSCIVEMPVAAVRAYLLAVPEGAVAFVDDLAARLAISIYHQRSLAFNPVTVRLANFLLDYAEWTNEPSAREWAIALSQDEMAAAIGATRRSIGKDVTAWQKEGILERRGSCYVVRDAAILERYADRERLRLAYRIGNRAGVESPQAAQPAPRRSR